MDYLALDLEAKYQHLCNTPSDINDALPVLRRFASECRHVTEFGIRTAVSTTALLAAQPDVLISYDLQLNHQFLDDLQRRQGRTSFTALKGDTLIIDIDPTDMLFIDTKHSYRQLKTELDRHAGKVGRFLAFHDTQSFRFHDEGNIQVGPRGLWPAIAEFLAREPWTIESEITTGNGLLVLKRTNTQ